MLAKVDTLNGASTVAAELNLRRNRTYVLFLDSQGREISRFMDEFGDRTRSRNGVCIDLNQINLPSIMTEMKRILGKGVTGESQLSLHLKRLDDRNPAVKKEAARILGKMRDHAEVIVPALITALKKKDPHDRASVEIIRILARFGPSAQSAIPELVKILRDNTLPSTLRQTTAVALGRIDRKGTQVVKLLSEMLGDPDIYVVIGAAIGLREIGSNAGEAVPALKKVLASTRHELTRDYLKSALNRIQAGK